MANHTTNSNKNTKTPLSPLYIHFGTQALASYYTLSKATSFSFIFFL